MYIKQSVGQAGINNKTDVFFIQELINIIADEDKRIPAVTVDGKIGGKTVIPPFITEVKSRG